MIYLEPEEAVYLVYLVRRKAMTREQIEGLRYLVNFPGEVGADMVTRTLESYADETCEGR